MAWEKDVRTLCRQHGCARTVLETDAKVKYCDHKFACCRDGAFNAYPRKAAPIKRKKAWFSG